jgi:hypothetical protein
VASRSAVIGSAMLMSVPAAEGPAEVDGQARAASSTDLSSDGGFLACARWFRVVGAPLIDNQRPYCFARETSKRSARSANARLDAAPPIRFGCESGSAPSSIVIPPRRSAASLR